MKKTALSILALALVFICGTLVVQAKKSPQPQKQLIAANMRDTSQVVNKEFKVGNFESIEVRGGLIIDVRKGSTPKVVASCNQNSMGKLLIRVINNTLSIKTSDHFTASHAQITVIGPNIKNITSYGSATVKANQISGGYLKISGHNVSTVESTGSVQKLFVNCDGKSFLKLDKLRSEDCVAVAAGKSCANLYASKTIKATASGQSVLNVSGKPRVLKKEVATTSFFKLR